MWIGVGWAESLAKAAAEAEAKAQREAAKKEAAETAKRAQEEQAAKESEATSTVTVDVETSPADAINNDGDVFGEENK